MTGPIHTTKRGPVLEVRIERGKANAIDAATSRIMGDVFAGFRGKSGDRAAVITAVEAVAAFADAHQGLIDELDVNPLLVLSDSAVAVDAWIKMRADP